MANNRGRGLQTMGQAFTPFFVDGGPSLGQPTHVRTWGIPTGPGWFDHPGKWNVIIPPVVIGVLELMRRLMGQTRV